MSIPIHEKSTVHYKGRQRSILGKISLAVGILALCFLVFLIVYGRKHSLPGSGGLGIVNGLLAITGMLCSAEARRDVPFVDGYATAGMGINLAVVIITFALILVGAAMQ
ncbi:MAG: hypothetical protein IJM57_03570 [Lachnospiraceae bacterium]|nr:hypothetical protein [Lachnospiraceae bacterium]